jgi:cell division protein FtsB
MLLAAALVALGLLAAIYVTRAIQIGHLQDQIGTLMTQKKTVLDRQTALHARLAQKNDPAAIEEVARLELGLVMPGEQKVIFVRKGD